MPAMPGEIAACVSVLERCSGLRACYVVVFYSMLGPGTQARVPVRSACTAFVHMHEGLWVWVRSVRVGPASRGAKPLGTWAHTSGALIPTVGRPEDDDNSTCMPSEQMCCPIRGLI